jgi:predicted nucleic acid-binding protein
MIISDASPLIHLASIGKLQFTLDLFQELGIPNAVHEEAIIRGIEKGYSDAHLLQGYVNSQKIKIVAIDDEDLLLETFLHKGEYESILLARKLKRLLLIDEQKGRLVAEQKGVPVITTAGVLLLLLRKKIIPHELYSKNLSKYAARGWLSSDQYQQYLLAGKKYEGEKS